MRCLFLIITIVLCQSVFAANPVGGDADFVKELRRILQCDEYSDSQLQKLQDSGLPELAEFAEEARGGNGPSYMVQANAVRSLFSYCRDNDLQSTDDYRFLLLDMIYCSDNALDYESCVQYTDELKENVERFVTDSVTRGYWHHIIKLWQPDALVIDCEMMRHLYASAAVAYRREHGIPNSELGIEFAKILMMQMATGIISAEDIDGLYKQTLDIANRLNPENHDTSDIEIYYVRSKLHTDFNQPSLLRRLSQLVGSLKDQSVEQSCQRASLSFFLLQNNQEAEAIAEVEKAYHVIDSINESSQHSVEGIIASVMCTRMLQSMMIGDSIRFKNLFDEAVQRYSARDEMSSRAMMILMSSLPQMESSVLIDRRELYSHIDDAISFESFLPARLPATCILSNVLMSLGQMQPALEMLDLATWLIDNEEGNPGYKGVFLAKKGFMKIGANQVAQGIDDCISSLNFLDPQEDAEWILFCYAEMANAYLNNNEFANAKLWADKYIETRSRVADSEMFHFCDISVECVRVQTIEDHRIRLREMEALTRRAEKMNITEILGSLYNHWAMTAYAIGDAKHIKQAAQYFDEAFYCVTHYNNFSDVLSFAQNYLSFLDAVGDRKKHNDVVHAIITGYEGGERLPSIPYLSLLSSEVTNAINDNNINDANYYAFKVSNALTDLMRISDNDPTICALGIGVSIPALEKMFSMLMRISQSMNEEQRANVSNTFGSFPPELFEQQILSYGEAQYRENINDQDEIYCNILLAKVNWQIANGRFDEAEALLDSIPSKQAYSSFKGDKRDFAPFLRMEIAQGRDDYDELERIFSLPEISSYISLGGFMNVNTISSLLTSISLNQVRMGRFDEAMQSAKRRYELVKSFINNQYATLPESERMALSDGVAIALDINYILPYANTKENRALAYDAALFFRNILLESSTMQRQAVYESGDSTTIAMYERRMALADEMQRISYDYSPEGNQRKQEILSEAHHLEHEISLRCPAINDLTLSRNVGWKNVARSLSKGEAAIEFINYIDHATRKWRYGALILRKGAKAPEFVPLLTQDELHECLSPRYTAAKLENGVNRVYSYQSNGRMLYNGLWQPLESYLDGVERIYFCPTATLNTVAFSAIEDSARVTLCQRYDLRMVSSTALITRKSRGQSGNNVRMSIMGNVDYDANPAVAASRRGSWQPLSNSINEVQYVDSLCGELPVVNSQLLTNLEASEDNFRLFSGNSPEMIHISSHGFYFDARTASRHSFFMNKKLTTDTVANEVINPLKRGGIILSDANPVWNNEEEREDRYDGILTADEFSQLDLRNTQLLVLSACETGLGEVTNTEGINGLQRGVKLSGVESMIMSLWLVNDRAGSLFMQRFYKHLLTDGEERHTAFRNTQLEMQRDYPRKPYMWAPFIMID